MQFGDDILFGLEAEHPLYSTHKHAWEIMRDCYNGELAVKAKREKYLPRRSSVDVSDYDIYLDRAYFFGATSRVVRGSVGILFGQEPSFHQDEKMKGDEDVMNWYNSLPADRSSFMELLRRLSVEFVMNGRVGILIDGQRNMDETFSPKLIRYRAEDIINWDYDRVQEGMPYTLRWVVLREAAFVPEDGDDSVPWERKEDERFRVLWLDENGYYNQAVYERKMEEATAQNEREAILRMKEKKRIIYIKVPGSHVIPQKAGGPMMEIPFWAMNYGGDSGSLEMPPLMEMALVNLSHYKSAANHANALSFAGMPTVVFTGTEDETGIGNINIGTGKAINFGSPDADVKFLELGGGSLAGLQWDMEQKEQKMAILGNRMLLPEPEKGQESSVTHKIRRKGENSVLASIADVISNKVTEIVRYAAEWALRGDPQKYRLLLVKEFSTLTPDANLLEKMSAMVALKQMSLKTFLENCGKMELLPTGTDVNAELENIKEGIGSDLVAEMIALMNKPKEEDIVVRKNGGNGGNSN